MDSMTTKKRPSPFRGLLGLAVLAFAGLSLVLGCSFSKGDTFVKVVEADRGEEAETEEPSDSGPPPEPTEPGHPEQPEEPEEPEEPPEDALTIRSDPSGASAYVNNRYVGRTPVELADLAYGSYKITLSKEGYYAAEVWITYGGGSQSVELALERIMGTLALAVLPDDAEIRVGGQDILPGLTQLPIGRYRLTARAFGYEELVETVVIYENRTTFVDMALEKAVFRLADPRLSRRSFNPANPGLLGKVRMSFWVSTYGSGTFQVIDADGATVFSEGLPRFTTWEQSVSWDGRRADGASLPDGRYLLQVTARGEDEKGSGAARQVVEETVVLDRSLTVAYRSVWCGAPGLLYTGTPDVLPPGSFQISTLFLGHVGEEAYRVPMTLAARIGLGRELEAALLAGLIMEDEASLPLIASGALRYRYLRAGRHGGLQMGANARISYQHGTGSDTFSNFTAMAFGSTAQLALGPVALILMPEIVLSPWQVTYDATFDDSVDLNLWMYGRAGLMLDFGAVVGGLSAAVRTLPFSQGFVLDTPLQAGFELHAMFPGTQLFMSFALAAEIEDEENWYVMGGGGVGYIY